MALRCAHRSSLPLPILTRSATQYGSDDDASELSNVEEGSEEDDEDEDDSEDEPITKGKRKAIPSAAKGKGKAPAPVKRRSQSILFFILSSHFLTCCVCAEGPRVEVEYEEETETLSAAQITSW